MELEKNRVKLHVWGSFGCFTRPEMKAERVTYDVITPSAARGILEAIYWKPQIRWVIERLHVLKPIRFMNIRRNEVGKRASERSGLCIEAERLQRATLLLRDVDYLIEAHFEVVDSTDPAPKHYEVFKRRAEKGQCFHRPYLGCREFAADFSWHAGAPPEPDSSLRGERDLGWMLHEILYVHDENGDVVEGNRNRKVRPEPRFFRATMRDGIIDVPPVESEVVTA